MKDSAEGKEPFVSPEIEIVMFSAEESIGPSGQFDGMEHFL